jgi:hypothetical protein
MTDAPPPYPGINGYHGYANGSSGAASAGAGKQTRGEKQYPTNCLQNNVNR